jgi:hypothetical protein
MSADLPLAHADVGQEWSPPSPRDSWPAARQRRVAIEEAGHAVVATVEYGWPIVNVTFERVLFGDRGKERTLDAAAQRIVVALAGREAIWLFAESDARVAEALTPAPAFDPSDAEQVREALRPIASYGRPIEHGDDLDIAEKIALLVCDDVEPEAEALVLLCRRRSRRMVSEHDREIDAVAVELERRGKLTGDDVAQILRGRSREPSRPERTRRASRTTAPRRTNGESERASPSSQQAATWKPTTEGQTK